MAMFRDRSPFRYGPSHVCEPVSLHVRIMSELLAAVLDFTRNTVSQDLGPILAQLRFKEGYSVILGCPPR